MSFSRILLSLSLVLGVSLSTETNASRFARADEDAMCFNPENTNRPDYDTFVDAVQKGDLGTVQKMIGEGFNVNEGCGRGTRGTPLVAAIWANQPEMVRFFLQHPRIKPLQRVGIGLNIFTPFVHALGRGNPKVIELFIGKSYADPLRILIVAARNNLPELMTKVLSAYPNLDINAKGPQGAMALHYAAYNNSVASLRELLNHGAEINIREQNIFGEDTGYTALHNAVERHQKEAVEFLLKQPNIDISLKTKRGETALDMAKRIIAEGPKPERYESIGEKKLEESSLAIVQMLEEAESKQNNNQSSRSSPQRRAVIE